MRSLVVLLLVIASSLVCESGLATAQTLATVEVRKADSVTRTGFDGVVEAARQTVIAAQVTGTVVSIKVKAGDVVKAGQVLLRLDARAADQVVVASEAQVHAANASLDVATRELERQRRLFAQDYISQAALDRAQAQFKSSQAEAGAQIAEASVANTQSGFYVVRAPYDGIVADLPAMPGDMAMPGRPLLTVYNPGVLRVTAAVPQSDVSALTEATRKSVNIELPGLPAGARWLKPVRVQILPTVDARTHTVQLWLDLPSTAGMLTPGMFARVWLPTTAGDADSGWRLYVPSNTVVRRAELTGLYIMDRSGKPQLRQVRVGRRLKDEVEILTGVSAGERVALDPDAAARFR